MPHTTLALVQVAHAIVECCACTPVLKPFLYIRTVRFCTYESRAGFFCTWRSWSVAEQYPPWDWSGKWTLKPYRGGARHIKKAPSAPLAGCGAVVRTPPAAPPSANVPVPAYDSGAMRQRARWGGCAGRLLRESAVVAAAKHGRPNFTQQIFETHNGRSRTMYIGTVARHDILLLLVEHRALDVL